jgi:hypothetical protein
MFGQKIMSIIGRYPHVSKSNLLHVNIFWFFFVKIGEYSMESSQSISDFPEVLNLNKDFLFFFFSFLFSSGQLSPFIDENR